MGQLHKFVISGLWIFLSSLPAAYAAESGSNTGASAAEVIAAKPLQDSLGRDTPRSSLVGFLQAAEEGDFVKAAEYLDLRNLPRKYRSVPPTRLAEMLAVVIEREIWIDLERLSDDPKGEAGDGLPAYRDELGRIEKGDKEFVLLMQRVPGEKGLQIWKVSNATVAMVADLYEKFGYSPLVEAFADTLPDGRFLGIEYFKWVVTLTAALIAYPLFMLLGLLLARLFSRTDAPLYPRVKRFFIAPFALLGVTLTMWLVIRELGVGITGQRLVRAHTLNSIVFVWLLLSGISLIRDAYANHLAQRGREGAIVLLKPVAQSIKILIVIIVVLAWLDNAGFDITTLLAGLGVGGIAVALALQKPMEDVFGALSLYTQQPVRVGDFCRIGKDTGTVEEIGLRTTRIRSLANSVISIPNARLASEAIDNYSARQKILYNPTLRLRMDTSREQVDRILQGIRELLDTHERVVKDNPRVRFQQIGKDALELVVFAYTDTRTWPDHLEVAEDLNMKILDIVDSAGTSLALPGQTLYMQPSPDNGSDKGAE
jgi:MscS family membrane protein